MRLLRAAVTVAVALAVLLLGAALVTYSRPATATVYGTDFRGPKITIDGGPRLERAPQFRVLVGGSRKKARWVQVNPLQYAGCADGDRWNGLVCSKFALQMPALSTRTTRHAVLLALAAAIVVVPVAAIARGSRHD